MKNTIPTVVVAALALASGVASAANFCVGNGAELQQALMSAANNGEADTIKIKSGTYSASGGSIAFAYTTGENFGLSVSGGYVSIPPLLCIQQIKQPSLTVLSGSDARQVIALQGLSGTSGALSISNLTIRDGFTSQSGAGLLIGGGGGYSGNVSVSRVVLDRNVSTTFGGGLTVFSDGGIVNVLNNLFLLNQCGSANCAINATVNAPSPIGFRAYFGNNTIVGNKCTPGSTCSATGARFGGSASAVFYNNVFALNTTGDLALQNFSGGSTELYNNNYVTISGTPPVVESGNLNYANPQFVDILDDDFRLTFASPLRNQGTSTFALLSDDLDGSDRVNDFRVDIGAYENSDQIFIDGFDSVE